MNKILIALILLALAVPIASALSDFTAFSQPNPSLCAGSAAYTNITIANDAAARTNFSLTQSGKGAAFSHLYPANFILAPGAYLNVYEIFNASGQKPGSYEIITAIQTDTGLHKEMQQKITLVNCQQANATGGIPTAIRNSLIIIPVALILLFILVGVILSLRSRKQPYEWEKYLEKRAPADYSRLYAVLAVIGFIVLAVLVKLNYNVALAMLASIKALVFSYRYYILIAIAAVIIFFLASFFFSRWKEQGARGVYYERPKKIERKIERKALRKAEKRLKPRKKRSISFSFGGMNKIAYSAVIAIVIIGLGFFFRKQIKASIESVASQLQSLSVPSFVPAAFSWIKSSLAFLREHIIYLGVGIALLAVIVFILERRKNS